LVNKTLLIVEDCNKQDEKGMKKEENMKEE